MSNCSSLQITSRALARSLWALVVLWFAVAALAEPERRSFQLETEAIKPTESGGQPPPEFLVPLVLDDGSGENSVGFSDGGTARQFLWFNRFDLSNLGHLELHEIWAFFPIGVEAGEPIELIAYHDADADPSNGADFLASWVTTIEVADGNDFSIYPIEPALPIPREGDLLIGVVPRFIESGVTPITLPAVLDTDSLSGRSWVAIWGLDPPSPPTLPADTVTVPIEDLTLAGTWMIRAYVASRPIVEVPTLGVGQLTLLTLLLALIGVSTLRTHRTRRTTPSGAYRDDHHS